MEKEFQLDLKVVQEAFKAVPRFMQEIEAAMIKPFENALLRARHALQRLNRLG